MLIHNLLAKTESDTRTSSFVVKNGTNILSCTSGKIPSPLSRTVIVQRHAVREEVTFGAKTALTSILGVSRRADASRAFSTD